MFNKVVLIGHLTRDIELRYSTSGNAMGNSAIAVTRKYTLNGEKREETCFIDITFFARQAEIANQYLAKGSKVLIEGRLVFQQWTDNNGHNRSKHSIAVENMEMLGNAGQQGSQGGQNSYGYGQQQGNQGSYGYGQQDSYSRQPQQKQQQYTQPQKAAAQSNYNQPEPSKIKTPSVASNDDDKYEIDETIPF